MKQLSTVGTISKFAIVLFKVQLVNRVRKVYLESKFFTSLTTIILPSKSIEFELLGLEILVKKDPIPNEFLDT